MMISIVLIRSHPDGWQSYAGTFDSDSPDFKDECNRAGKDETLVWVSLHHDEPLPPITWAEVLNGIQSRS